MTELYNTIVEKGGLYGIASVSIILILTVLIRSIKVSALTASDANQFWLHLLRFLRIFFLVPTVLFFTIELFKVVDNSIIVHDLLKPSPNNSAPAMQQRRAINAEHTETPVVHEPASKWKIINENGSKFSYPSNRAKISNAIDFSVLENGSFKIIKKEDSFFGGYKENTYLVVPLSDIEKFVIIYQGGNRQVAIVYKKGIPSDLFPTDEEFVESNFVSFVEYKLKAYNRKIAIEFDTRTYAIQTIGIILSLIFLFYIVRRWIKRTF